MGDWMFLFIIERSYGDYEGIMSSEEADRLELRVWKAVPVPVPNGEAHLDVYKRIETFLDKLREKYAGKNVLVVSHNGPARCLKWYFDGFPQDGAGVHKTANCEIVEYDL